MESHSFTFLDSLDRKLFKLLFEFDTIMEGKTFFVLFGLGLVQVLASLYMALTAPFFTINFEILVALTFAAAIAHFLHSSLLKSQPETAFLVIAFAIGFLNVVYLSFHIITVWLVLMIILDAAGFILALEELLPKKRRPVYVMSYPSHTNDHAMLDKFFLHKGVQITKK